MPATIEELNRSNFELDNQIEDINYLKKELLQLGVMPSKVDQEDMIDLLTVLHAKPQEERRQSVEDAFSSMQKMMKGG